MVTGGTCSGTAAMTAGVVQQWQQQWGCDYHAVAVELYQ